MTLSYAAAALAAGASLIAGANARQVAPKPDLMAAIDAMPLDRLCTTEQALGYRFGAIDYPPSVIQTPGIERHKLDAAAAPFETASFTGSKWSARYVGAIYTFAAGDKQTALAAIQRIAKRFRQRGWVERQGGIEEDGPIIDYPPGPGEVNFYSRAEAMRGPSRQGVRASLRYLGSEVSFACEDMAMVETHAREVFGDLPPGTPRPAAPTAPRPKALDPALCATAEGRAGIDAATNLRTQDALTRFIVERMNYRERIVVWKTDRLEKSGKVSKARMLELATSGFGGKLAGNPFAGLNIVMEMLKFAEKAEDLRAAGDPAGACRATLQAIGGIEKVETVTAAQWAGMESAIDAEATRLGISLD
ncbi:hypothetical protein ACQKOH_16700 [Sphingomonas sp. NPDC092331]|jgi:hypothetical protein